jgi:hypothetical protein
MIAGKRRRTALPIHRQGASRLRGLGAFAQLPFWAYELPMQHRGIRYALRIGIAPHQWSVAIHPPGVEAIVQPFKGSRRSAELKALSMIDRWLKSHPRQAPKIQTETLPPLPAVRVVP